MNPRGHNTHRLSSIEREHHATWLELFYDLVFAAAISQIWHSLYVTIVQLSAFLEKSHPLFLYGRHG
jgi:low temperature requirement protein LtrA